MKSETLRILSVIVDKIYPSKVAFSYKMAKLILQEAVQYIKKPTDKDEDSTQIEIPLGFLEASFFKLEEHVVYQFRWNFVDRGAIAQGVVDIFRSRGLDARLDTQLWHESDLYDGYLTVVIKDEEAVS